MEFERRTFELGQPLFLEGEPGDCAFLIEQGAVEVIMTGTTGKEKKLAILSRGDIIGEMSLVDSAPRGATCKATEHTKVSVITKDIFEERLSRSNPMVRMLLTSLVKRIRDTNYINVNVPTEGWRPL